MLWVTAAYGACFIGIQWGLRDAPLLWFAALRALVAGVALLVVAGAQRRPAPRGASIWRLIALLGVVNVAIGFAAMFGGVSGLATGTAAVLSNAQPLLILLPAWWLYGEAVSARTTGALLVGFVGLLVVAVPGGGGRGAGLALLSAVAITTGTLLARRLVGVDLVVAGGWHLVLGGVVLTVAAAVVEGSPSISWTPRFVAVVAFLGLVGTAATTLAWFAEVRDSRLDALSAWTFLTPVFGIVLGGAVLGEVPTGWTAVGLAVVLGSMWLVLRPRFARWSSVARAARSAGIPIRRGRASSP
ncbi:MAG: DMT family transporter [Actinomycetales bacterium]|nr:DMT family transporter [Actinomycetales bacterium]